jgi:outer membrane protein OmpA-like peptidoglycan-associated protein
MIMKKILVLCAVALTVFTYVSAQTVENSKLTDNWFLGIDAGGFAKVKNPGRDFRSMVGFKMGRYLTPVFGLRFDAQLYTNSNFLNPEMKPSKVAFDYMAGSIDGLFNLNNLFCSYKGTPDCVEWVLVTGIGGIHGNGSSDYRTNKVLMKIGGQLNINLGKSKAWQINIEPDACYYTGGGVGHRIMNLNRAFGQITGGLTYKFGNSNGTHNFKLAKIYDQAEINALNAKINGLRNVVTEKDNTINGSLQQIEDLKTKLAECEATPKTVTKSEIVTNTTLAPVVIFDQGKAVINPSQAPSVNMIAKFLKNHPASKLLIKGYASPEGKAEVNQKLSLARANAVKNMLVNKYRVDEERLTVQGMGATTDVFSEADWNRVCTFIEIAK